MKGPGFSRREVLTIAAVASRRVAVSAPPAPSIGVAGTTPWQVPKDIAAEQYREMRGFLEGQIALCRDSRVPGTRDQLREMIGAIDVLQSPRPKSEPLGSDAVCTADLVSWQILKLGNLPSTAIGPAGAAVHEQGILLRPVATGKLPAVITIPDASESAADLTGLRGNQSS